MKVAPTNPVIIYNTDSAQSLADGQWYAMQRGLAANYLGFNFGSGSGALTLAQYTGTGSFSCQNATHNGVDVTAIYGGMSLQGAWLAYQSAYGIDCVLLSTFTPFQLYDGTMYYYTLPGKLSSDINPIIAHGRLGYPGSPYSWSWGSELTPKSGAGLVDGISPLLYQATINALASEARSNASQNHWGTSTLDYAPYITSLENTAILSYWSGQGLSTVDLGGVTGTVANVNSTDFFSGAVAPPPSLFALCIGSSAFNTTGTPGSEGFSNNYLASAGSWGFTWNSFDYHWGGDLLYNGGSAVMSDTEEPFASNLLDPLAISESLLSNHASLCYLPVLISISYPATPILTKGLLTVAGDPLYAPYKNTFTPIWSSAHGLIGKTPVGI